MKNKKKYAAAIIIAVIVLAVIGGCMGSASAASKHHRVSAKVCVKQYLHWNSKKFKKCERQGWYYERGSYPVSTETTPWTMANYILVYGPKGRLWVDTSGFYSTPNVR